MLHQGRQAYNIEIQLEIVNQIVRFIVQLPVDIGEQGADFVQLHGILQHIDQDDARENWRREYRLRSGGATKPRRTQFWMT